MMRCANEMRDAFFDALYRHAVSDRRIIVLSNDFGAPSLDQFRTNIPGQFVNAGISEQNIIGVAAGLALAGKRVCVYSIASFITLRCLEQIKIDLCTMRVPVMIAGVGPCFAYDTDGPTHHATEDISLFRTLVDMTILSPCDSYAAAAMADTISTNEGPSYVRLDRGKMPAIYADGISLDAGCRITRQGTDMCLVATGIMTHRAMEVAELLAVQGVSATVVDVYKLKPLPTAALLDAMRASHRVAVIEEHTMQGGLGSMMAELLADAGTAIPLLRLGIPDTALYAYGQREALQAACGLDRKSIVDRIIAWR